MKRTTPSAKQTALPGSKLTSLPVAYPNPSYAACIRGGPGRAMDEQTRELLRSRGYL